jgi:transposase
VLTYYKYLITSHSSALNPRNSIRHHVQRRLNSLETSSYKYLSLHSPYYYEPNIQSPNIPVNPRNGRKPRPYNTKLYKKMRSAVGRFFRWIKSFRRIIIRYERLASTYKALITIASIIIHLRYGI